MAPPKKSAGSGIANLALGFASALHNDIMNEQQFNRNIEMWKMMNEYNKPINQKNRLLEAGMNPLFYGLDGNSAGLPQPAPTPSNQSPFESMLVAKQMQEMDGNIKLQNANADKAQAEADAQNITNEYLRDKLEDERTSRHFQATYDAHRHQWLFNTPVDPTKDSFSFEDSYAWKEFESKYAELRANIAKSNYDKEWYESKQDYILTEIQRSIDLLDASADEKEYLAKQAKEVWQNLITQGEQAKFDFKLDKDNKDWTQKMGIFGKLMDFGLRLFGK